MAYLRYSNIPMKIPVLQIKFPMMIALLLLIAGAEAKNYQFNEKKVPETKGDLLSIQQALVDHLPQTRAATVGIKLAEGFGSGVIVSPEGLVLTAAHVSGGVDKQLTVIMNDGTEYKAVTMGLISNTDAAMMRIVDESAEESFPYVKINKNNDYKLGHWVYALGHSGGFDEARGPVVRLGRIVQDKETTLQTDCKVIGGDSGGPLFDMDGMLIGIHSRVGKDTVVENLHVPMREYVSHWDEMKKNEFVGNGPFAQRPVKGSGFLGVGSTDTDDGVSIQKVASDSAAEMAGLQVGDLILEINGDKIENKAEMKAVLAEMAEGDTLELKISSEGETETVKLTLGKR